MSALVSKRFVYCLAAITLFFCFTGITRALNGTVQTVTFTGPITGQPVTFSIYLPQGYSSTTNRYPLIIHLHGIGGTHNGQHTNLVPASLESAVAGGLIEPCIIVFPDGYGDSFWADSANSNKPAETNVRYEILPYVEANYRTVATRQRRIIQGFSMGGFGAAKFATKYPDLFAACVVYDGAMLSWLQIQQRHPIQAAEIFDNDAATFNLFSPWDWLTNNSPVLQATMPLRDAVGALLNENRAWRDALVGQSITPSYVETGSPHSLGPLLDAEGTNSWKFIAQVFSNATTTTNFTVAIRKQGTDIVLNWPSKTGEVYRVEHNGTLSTNGWFSLVTNVPPSGSGTNNLVITNALLSAKDFFRVVASTNSTSAPPAFTFTWTGTNFTYIDANRSFTGIMLKPAGNGPFPAVMINHGAGGTATGYSLQKARDMVNWGMVCIGPTLSHAAGGETNSVNMGFCPENLARAFACMNVLTSLSYVDTNRIAIFGHSMGAFATIGDTSTLGSRIRAGSITAGGVIPDSAGSTNPAPTVSEANAVNAPFIMFHCDADGVVPPARSLLFQQMLTSNTVVNQRILYSSNSIAATNWHNIHQDSAVNADVLTNTFQWFKTHGVLP